METLYFLLSVAPKLKLLHKINFINNKKAINCYDFNKLLLAYPSSQTLGLAALQNLSTTISVSTIMRESPCEQHELVDRQRRCFEILQCYVKWNTIYLYNWETRISLVGKKDNIHFPPSPQSPLLPPALSFTECSLGAGHCLALSMTFPVNSHTAL